jgi:hypothetical protein
MTDCINGSNLSKNENNQIKVLPPYIIQSLLVSPNRPKHAADDTRPKDATFASVVNMYAIIKIAIAIIKSSISSSAPYLPI